MGFKEKFLNAVESGDKAAAQAVAEEFVKKDPEGAREMFDDASKGLRNLLHGK